MIEKQLNIVCRYSLNNSVFEIVICKLADVVVKVNNELKIMQEEQFLKDVLHIAKVEKPFSQFDPAFREYDMVYKVTTTDGMSKTMEVPELMYENMAGTSLLEQVVAFKNLLH